jgi:LuxR family maltose regulon positive regulatory protein
MIEIGSAYALGWLSLTEGVATLYEGDYVRAYSDILAALSRTRSALGEDAELCDTMALIASKCAVEMGLFDEARQLLRRGLRTTHCHGTVGSTALGFEAAIKLWDGETSPVISMSDAREIARSYPPRLSLMLSCYLTQRLLALGRLEDALAEASRIGLNWNDISHNRWPEAQAQVSRYRDIEAATQIDLLIATRNFKQASVLIEQETQLARKDGRYARLVELGLTRMTVDLSNENRLSAKRELIAAIRLAASRRIVLPFMTHLQTISILFEGTTPSSWPFSLREEQQFFRLIWNDIALIDASPLKTTASDETSSNPPTKRELDILRLIEGGLSNQQIADRVDVSVGTVKWHLKNLYQKFGVSNRTAALARARSVGLLAR